MSTPIIKVEHLSKKFILRHENAERYTALRDVITNKAKLIVNQKPSLAQQPREEFWAINDISFEVNQGDRVGIIGRNGAGKSTLLKLLSRIVTPTKGRITIEGRVSSLLEVGTGFHPELTGRENIFLNGSILGMAKSEIKNKFDEIVAFAEIEKFLDTPVKRYSSGMYVRLAFAVAANLEPDVLIVDEVLAVGDTEFQKKCLGKMKEVSGEGRTVIFVSHNMAAIQQLCTTGFLLEKGQIKKRGLISEIVDLYATSSSTSEAFVTFNKDGKIGINKPFSFNWIKMFDDRGELRSNYSMGENINFVFEISNTFAQKKAEISLQIHSSDGMPIFHMMCRDSNFEPSLNKETEIFEVPLSDIRLFPGTYSVTLTVTSTTGHEVYDCIKEAIDFTILDGGKYTSRSLPRAAGLFFMNPKWKQI